MPNIKIYFSDEERAEAQRRNAMDWYNRKKRNPNSVYGTKNSRSPEYHKIRYQQKKLQQEQQVQVTSI